LDVTYDRLIVSGGGAKSDLLTQIFADALGLPATRNEVSDGAGLGSAICAGVGSGVFASFDEAIRAMVRPRVTLTPKAANTAVYTRLGEIYSRVRQHTDPVFAQTHALFG
jgi:sugar (pentulose or hexulose) kinase